MSSLAAIIRRHGSAYVQRFGSRMPLDQLRAMRAIVRCRTPPAGSELWCCKRCGKLHETFHSCGNRHCPTCGAEQTRRWLQRQERLQLPVTYYLVTVTVPEALRKAIRSHPRQMLPMLFKASSSALLDACRNPKWFGATPGMTAVLHTWSRALIYHPHIHFLVTGGGWASSGAWQHAQHGFLVPESVVAQLTRARVRDGTRHAHPEIFAQIPSVVWQQDWVVNVKPVGSGQKALRYLARYLYRVALSNWSIVSHSDRHVTFRYRDSTTGKLRKLTLPPFEFLRRFLQHVLPKGFVKVRYYGLHHPARRAQLTLARAALHLAAGATPPPLPLPPEKRPLRCPACGTPMRHCGRLPPRSAEQARAPP